MRHVTEYMIGNAAVQVVRRGNRIKVVDVEENKRKKEFFRNVLVWVSLAGILTLVCFYVVRLNNQHILLGESIESLQSQVVDLEAEKNELRRETDNFKIDYKKVMRKAKAMGMKFPKKGQVHGYKVSKSTAIRRISAIEDE
ncbi:MAG: hypothetical protein K6G62_03505 [Eubacterium sp.]|nr:hypothetical protein [Eubacterium sp.]